MNEHVYSMYDMPVGGALHRIIQQTMEESISDLARERFTDTNTYIPAYSQEDKEVLQGIENRMWYGEKQEEGELMGNMV